MAARSAALTLEPLPNLERITPPEEYGDAFEANASLKAIYYSAFTSEIVLADDSGLSVDALHGAPGINSARYAGPGADAAASCKWRAATLMARSFASLAALTD